MSQSAMPSPTPSAALSLTLDEIRAQLEALRARDLPTHGGRTLAYVYDSGLALPMRSAARCLPLLVDQRPRPDGVPSLLAMENDLVGIAGRLVDAPDGFAGVVTSGGTESILLAVLAARDARPDVTAPRMVLPTTAHAAFHKAAHWLGVEPVFVDVDPSTKEPSQRRWPPPSTSAPSSSWPPRRPTPTASSTRSSRSPQRPLPRGAVPRRCLIVGVLPPARRRDQSARPGPSPSRGSRASPRPAQVRLHPQGRLDPAPRLCRPAPDSPLRLREVARLHDAQHDGPVDEVRRPARRCLGRRPPHRCRPLWRAGSNGTHGHAGPRDRGERHTGLVLAAQPDSTLLALTTDETCDVFTIADEMLARGWYVQPQMRFGELPPRCT